MCLLIYFILQFLYFAANNLSVLIEIISREIHFKYIGMLFTPSPSTNPPYVSSESYESLEAIW